jgi:hypothetical protein
MHPHDTTFYVYLLCRPNGKPFYVGKGKGIRIFRHDDEARRGHECHKCNVIRKIWRNGGQVIRYTIFTTDDESAAFAYEREMIALYGRKNLTNLTDGGDGVSGRNGEQSASARFTWVQVREVRRRYAAGGITAATLAAELGTHQTCISKIVRNETWHDPDYTPPADTKSLNKPVHNGTANGRTRLSWENVHTIRAQYASGVSSADLAATYGMIDSSIRKIVCNTTWHDPDYTPPPHREERRLQKLRKLNRDIAQEIRARYAAGDVGYAALGKEYGVATSTIVHVIRGDTYR